MANATFEDHPTDPDKVILRKNRIITPAEMVASIIKIMDDVASEYPEEEREELKAVMLGQ